MRGVSRASLAEGRGHLLAALAGPAATDGTALAVGSELFTVVHLLDREHALRRALSDPAKPADEKAAVAGDLLAGQVSPATSELTAAAVRYRWSSPGDLTDALEQFAVTALLIVADAQGQLDDVEDQLFRFSRMLVAEPDLRVALSSPFVSPERKRGLLDSLLTGKVSEVAMRLIAEAAGYPRGRSLDRSLTEYVRLAAERRQRVVAVVRTATELSARQRARLATALAAAYGHEVQLNMVLDPHVLGGLAVQVGDEVIDGTVVSRMETVRRRLAG